MSFNEFGLPVGINSSFVPDSCKVEFVAAFLYGRFIRLIFQSKKTVQSVRHQFQLAYFAARSLMFRGKLSLFPPIVFRKDHERNRCSWFSCTKGSGNYCRLARSCALTVNQNAFTFFYKMAGAAASGEGDESSSSGILLDNLKIQKEEIAEQIDKPLQKGDTW